MSLVSYPEHESNRAVWSEAARRYADDTEATLAFLRAGGTNFVAPEYDFLRPLMPCDRAIHLQCAGGRDTLSLWNLGAREVIGVDINEDMIALARLRGEALGASAQWIRSDVLETPEWLNGTADLVYTGRGAVCWLMDIEAWARVIARLLRPGGHFYFFDGHPVSWVWDLNAEHFQLDADYGDYFSARIYEDEGWPTSYIPEAYQQGKLAKKFERQWTVAQLVNALITAGLALEKLGEHPDLYWDTFPNFAPELAAKLPQTLSILARKPE
ncbi:class I SAM-dependent methyltransferase [Armatimonas sp.]|uniref:class I SAM-dependent methyltransferase n=1 Tax=Armatimonas sp. TaxID=1872638 RepID=UPI00374CADA4